MKRILLAAALALPGLAAAPADAADYAFSFAVGTTLDAFGTITTSDLLNGKGGYDILGIDGFVGSAAIEALVANPDQPGYAYFDFATHSVSSGFTTYPGLFFDNVLYTDTGGHIDEYGILLKAGGAYFNFCGPTRSAVAGCSEGQAQMIGESGNPASPYAVTTGTFSITALAPTPAPEAASWAMFVGGFGMVGGGLRMRRPAADPSLRT